MTTLPYTDRFETVLPFEVRDELRFRSKTKYAALSVAAESDLATVSEVPPKTRSSPWKKIVANLRLASLVFAVIIAIAMWLSSGASPFRTPNPETRYPVSVPSSDPNLDRLLELYNAGYFSKPLDSGIHESRAPAPTPSASSAPRTDLFEAWRYKTITMPYGERVIIRYIGEVPSQDLLPLSGNRVGDAYRIGKNLFVWVTPNGVPGMWIDPVL